MPDREPNPLTAEASTIMPSQAWKRIPGIFGLVLAAMGIWVDDPEIQRRWFLGGWIGMTLTAILERHRLFLVLQGVVLVGILVSAMDMPARARQMIPLAGALVLVGLFHRHLPWKTASTTWGLAGLGILAIGYAAPHPAMFLAGGIVLSIYAGMEIRNGFKPGWIWLVLNLLFALSAAIRLWV